MSFESAYVPPSDILAEQSVLGSVLIDRRALDLIRETGLNGDHFYRPGHTLLWSVMESLSARGVPPDFVTVKDELERRGPTSEVGMAAIGGVTYLMALMDAVPTAANAAYYAGIVCHHATRREVCAAGLSLVAMGQAESESAEAVIAEAEQRVLCMATGRTAGSNSETLGRLMAAQYERSEAMQLSGGKLLGLSTGLASLDRLTSGLQSPDLLILAGRPGTGKTSLLLSMAVHAALHLKKPVVLFSLEMSKEQYAGRVACVLASLDSQKLRLGKLNEDEWTRFLAAVNMVENIPMVIDDTPSLTPSELSATLRRVRRELGGLALVGVDYLQLMDTDKSTENRTQQVSKVVRDLKHIALSERVPLVALSQLSREVEKRATKRPMMSDLRESGEIEAAADTVALLYNEAYYARQENADIRVTDSTVDEVEFIVGKHRSGPTGVVKIGFQPAFTRFADISMRDDEPTGY